MIGENNLEEKCLHLLDETAEDALKSEAFTKITLSTVEKILKRDTLNIEEIDVYKACLNWAEAECKRQKIEVTIKQTSLILYLAGADPGFPVGGGTNLRHRCFSVKTYVKTKEFGPVGGGGAGNFCM